MYLIGLMSQLEIVLIMTNCTGFIRCSTWYKTAVLEATSLDKIKQLMKAWLPLREDFIMLQYLPAKPYKREIKILICCDADTVYLHQFEVYLGWQKKPDFGLGYDVVMKLCKYISGKYHHVYCDNLFTSVQLLKDLLACKTYCNGTICVNKKYLPEGICKLARMICGWQLKLGGHCLARQ